MESSLETPRTAGLGLFPRTRQSLANSARSLQTRKQIVTELERLTDRALADIGIYRCDINAFAKHASRNRQGEPVIQALHADLRQIRKAAIAAFLAPKTVR